MTYEYNLGLRFQSIAASHGGRVALRMEDGSGCTYAQLNATANRIAVTLAARGIRQRDVVCIEGRKDVLVFASIIACLKLGVTYSIFDPESPLERLKKIFGQCRPTVCLVGEQWARCLHTGMSEGVGEILDLFGDTFLAELETLAADEPSGMAEVTGTTPAYIMFTSGSTGTPKGAVMSHANVLNLIAWGTSHYGIDHTDVITNVNPIYFDNSVFDIYTALFSGASLVPFGRETVTDAAALVELVDRFKCTQWFSVPTLLMFLQTMKTLRADTFVHLKRIIFGGEGFPKAKLKKLFDLYGERVEIHNVYGPTECTCICSSYRISADDFADLEGYPPLGSLIPNFSYFILDEQLQPVPPGTWGQLCLLGPNVGLGYFRDERKTEAAFRRSPLREEYNEVMYCTGDLVKLEPKDGKLHIRGRCDNQIKHMGYRIELEEIETALAAVQGVEQAVVVHGFRRGLSRLVAVVSTNCGMTEAYLREQLSGLLPAYMIPSEFLLQVEELPKNANGKVDRKHVAASCFGR